MANVTADSIPLNALIYFFSPSQRGLSAIWTPLLLCLCPFLYSTRISPQLKWQIEIQILIYTYTQGKGVEYIEASSSKLGWHKSKCPLHREQQMGTATLCYLLKNRGGLEKTREEKHTQFRRHLIVGEFSMWVSITYQLSKQFHNIFSNNERPALCPWCCMNMIQTPSELINQITKAKWFAL